MANKIQFKRGVKANLPILNIAEPAFTTDTNEFYIGNGTSNIKFAKQSDLDIFSNKVNNLNIVNVKDYGAKGDGSTDDTTAFVNAISAGNSTGFKLYIPSGIYKLSSRIIITNKPINIEGAGIEATRLVWEQASANGGGIKITQTNYKNHIAISNFTMETKSSIEDGTAIEVDLSGELSGGVISDRLHPRMVISNILIKGYLTTNGWNYGIKGINLIHSKTSNITFIGRESSATPSGRQNANSAISLSGTGSPVENNFDNIWAFYCQNAFNISEYCEGVNIHQSTFVAVGTGVAWNTTLQRPQLVVRDSHINAYNYCINATNLVQSTISGNMFYKREDSTSDTTGILLTTSDQNSISENTFVNVESTGTYNFYCITVNSGEYNDISNNIVQKGTTGITLQTNANYNSLTDNKFKIISTTILVNGNYNILRGNEPSYEMKQFDANATTPRVDQSNTEMFFTNNSSPTTITNFSYGRVGQVIYLLINDVNTTLKHNSSLLLKGAIDYSPTQYTTMIFRKEINSWREISRN